MILLFSMGLKRKNRRFFHCITQIKGVRMTYNAMWLFCNNHIAIAIIIFGISADDMEFLCLRARIQTSAKHGRHMISSNALT